MPRGDGTGPTGQGPFTGRGGGGGGRGGMGGGGGRGRNGGFAMGPSGECICPKCGNRVAHQRGVPCINTACPKCGTMMSRG
ncbi:MAG TPA: hypothetical protein PLN69_03105 [bacterium]|nr:hypothetical protein [bacterium]